MSNIVDPDQAQHFITCTCIVITNPPRSSGTISLFVSFIMVKQGYVFVYNRSKISALFILQFVCFANCKHLFYFLQFNLFYKLGPHSVHFDKIKCISKISYKDVQTRIINNVLKNV